MQKVNTSRCKLITVNDGRLIQTLTGFACEGISDHGTLGCVIFIPANNAETLIDILRR